MHHEWLIMPKTNAPVGFDLLGRQVGRRADVQERHRDVVQLRDVCGAFMDLQANEGARVEPLKLKRWFYPDEHKEAQPWAVYCCRSDIFL